MLKLLDRALARRNRWDLGETDARRLVDGEGDGLPGTFLDDFAGSWLVSTTSGSLPEGTRRWLASHERPVYWKLLDQHDKESPHHLCGPERDGPFTIRECGALYQVSFQSGYSQGIFLDQRDNRQRVRSRSEPGHTILNAFAYTGAFSVAAALGGATTTTLDLSQPYLDWARDNLRLNGIDPGGHFFIKGDSFHWLKRFGKQGRRFHGIILDPPSFSRDDKGKVFRADKGYARLVKLAAACLLPGGWILCTTNHRGIAERYFEKAIRTALPAGTQLDSYPMPPDFAGEPYLKTILAEI